MSKAQTVEAWREACTTDPRGWVWLSICSKHSNSNPFETDCGACQTGRWEDPEELVADDKLFREDYTAWYRKHNNGAEPTESAWETWRLITRDDEAKDGV